MNKLITLLIGWICVAGLFSLNVNAQCDATLNFSDQPPEGVICEGEDLPSLIATPAPGNAYAWAGPNGFSVTTTNSFIPIPGGPAVANTHDGVYTVTVTCTDNSTGTATATLTIQSGTTVNATADVACGTDDAILDATDNDAPGTAVYTWSAGAMDNGDGTATVTAPMSGSTYTVTVTSGTGCVGTATVAVTVAPEPTATAVGTSVCEGESGTISASATGGTGAYTYSWSSGDSGTAVSVMPSTTTPYTVTVSDVNNCTATAVAEVTVNPLPNNGIIPHTNTALYPSFLSVCSGERAGYKASATVAAGSTYEWSATNGATVVPTTVNNRNALVDYPANNTPGDDYYTVFLTVTNSNTSCFAIGSVAVTVHPLPSPIAVTSAVCEGEAATLDATGGEVAPTASYMWSNAAELTDNGNGTATIATPTTDLVYTVTVTSGDGCTGTSTVAVTVNPLPTVEAVTSAVCDGENATLDATDNNASLTVTYAWSAGAINNNDGTATVSAPAVGNATYFVTITDGVTNCSNTASVEVTVNPLPDSGIEAVGANLFDEFCSGEDGEDGTGTNNTTSARYRAVTDNGGGEVQTYTWSVPDADAVTQHNTFDNDNVGRRIIRVNWPDNNTGADALHGVFLTVTDANGCSSASSIEVTIHPLPTVMAVTSAICVGEDATLDATGSTAQPTASYAWSMGAMDNGDGTATVSAPSAGNATYFVTVTSGNNCSATGSVETTVYALPTVTAESTAVCDGEVVELEASTDAANPGSLTYEWSEGTTPTGASTATVDEPEDGAIYYVTVTNTETNCTATASVEITVHPLPTPEFNPNHLADNTTVCSEESGVPYRVRNPGFEAYSWSVDNGTATNNPNDGDGKQRVVVDWPVGPDTGGVFVTVTDENSCTSAISVAVTILAPVEPVITGTFDYCRGREAFLDAGTYPAEPNTYAWTNGASTQTIATTVVGIYTVTVTTDDGCSGTASAEVTAIPCLAEAGTLTTNADELCPEDPLVVTTSGENQDPTYSTYFFLYTRDNLSNTTYVAQQEATDSEADFGAVAPGKYTVCVYNECTDCDPDPSPITTELDDIADTGTIQDGCYDYECTDIVVPEPLESGTGTGLAQENNGTGENIYIIEVCGGTGPYMYDKVESAPSAFVSGPHLSITVGAPDNPVTTVAGPGCVLYRVTYAEHIDWTITFVDNNDCESEDVVFSSEGTESMPLPTIDAMSTISETCTRVAGKATRNQDGRITAIISGGDNSCTEYTWAAESTTNSYSDSGTFPAPPTDGSSTLSLTDLSAGLYQVTITDCAGTTSYQEAIVRRPRRCDDAEPGKTAITEDLAETVKVYPNPFSNQTTVEFSISEAAHVDATIITIDGRVVANIYSGTAEGGLTYRLPFNSDNLPSGVYILEITTDVGAIHHERLYIAK